MTPSPRLHAALHLLTGGGCLGGALWIRSTPDAAVHWQLLEEPLLAAGLIIWLLALLCRRPRIARLSTDLCVALLAIAFAVAVLETGFRVAQYDFRGLETARRRLPPFYQKPRVPTGGAFLFSDHRDRPGLIGAVGTITGKSDINISSMQLVRLKPRGEALMILALDEAPDQQVQRQILAIPDVKTVKVVKL